MAQKVGKTNKIRLPEMLGKVVIAKDLISFVVRGSGGTERFGRCTTDETVCCGSAAKRMAAELKDIGAKLRIRRHDAMAGG
jgi:hypothetical protein